MDKFEPFTFDPTAFMSGQMESKLWLCDVLYGTLVQQGLVNAWSHKGGAHVDVLAGWYCLTNLLLRAQNRIPISHVASFDSDPEATRGALVLNESFNLHGEFDAFTADVNEPTEYGPLKGRSNLPPDLVINTAVEHIDGRQWFDDGVAPGALVVLQSNDMEHLDEHVNTVRSVDDLASQYQMTRVLYTGTKNFDYQTWSFNRFMIIGYK